MENHDCYPDFLRHCIINGWEPSNDGTASNYSAYKTGVGDSWWLFASLDAKGVSASVTPSVRNLSQFSAPDKYIGTGHVYAKRHNYQLYHPYSFFGSNPFCSNRHDGECLGHEVEGDVATTDPDDPEHDPELHPDDALTLDIVWIEKEKH